MAARRQYQVTRPWLGTLRRDLGPTVYALAVMPVLVYLASYAPWFASETAIDEQNVAGCGAQSCVKAEMLVGTPAMWWLAVPVLVFALWRMLVRRDWRYAAVLVGYCAGWLPWFADIDRQMYFFYAATMAPFLVMAIALICGDILYTPGAPPRRLRLQPDSERRTLGLIAVCFYVALVVTNFAWLFPVLTGLPISQQTWNMEIWLPSWR